MTLARNYRNKLVHELVNEFGEVIVRHVDIEKYISLLSYPT